MKRLTERVEGEALPLEGVTEVDLVAQLCDYEDTGLSPHAARMANLYLADYEATGMTPVQILNLKDEKNALYAEWAKLEQAHAFTEKLRREYNERLAEDKRVYRDEVRRLNRTLQENHEKLIASTELYVPAVNDMNKLSRDNAYAAAMKRDEPADVKPVARGEWIDFGDELDKSAGRHSYQCSRCFTDASYFISGFEWDEWTAPNFCPNCGADMREENEDE